MRNNRYPQGYLPKIAYWYAKCWSISVDAFLSPTARTPEWEKAWEKYAYFHDKQEMVYGRLTRSQEYDLDALIRDNLGEGCTYRGLL